MEKEKKKTSIVSRDSHVEYMVDGAMGSLAAWHWYDTLDATVVDSPPFTGLAAKLGVAPFPRCPRPGFTRGNINLCFSLSTSRTEGPFPY